MLSSMLFSPHIFVIVSQLSSYWFWISCHFDQKRCLIVFHLCQIYWDLFYVLTYILSWECFRYTRGECVFCRMDGLLCINQAHLVYVSFKPSVSLLPAWFTHWCKCVFKVLRLLWFCQRLLLGVLITALTYFSAPLLGVYVLIMIMSFLINCPVYNVRLCFVTFYYVFVTFFGLKSVPMSKAIPACGCHLLGVSSFSLSSGAYVCL